MRNVSLILLLIVPAAVSPPSLAYADWLVTKDGARVETKGPWKVKGRQVVFTLPNGTLSALRLDEVDLDKSAEATYEAENPPPPPEEEKPAEPILTLTDDDVAGARRLPSTDAATEREPGEGQGEVTINEPYSLLDWNARPRAGGIEIRGTLVYSGEEERVDGINMIVRLFSTSGVQIAETSAALTTPTLRTGAATTFRAAFPEVDETESYRAEVEVVSGEGRR